MDFRADVKHRLRSARNWPSLLEELEREVEQVDGKEARAARLFELGVVAEDLFLEKIRAMHHYQAAFKLNPTDARALERARRAGSWVTLSSRPSSVATISTLPISR